jgi:hypothetical protein
MNVKANRLWKFEDTWTKIELYATGYSGSSPLKASICCNVLVRAHTFSGQYLAALAWQDILDFGRTCAATRLTMQELGPQSPGQVVLNHPQFISVSVEPCGQRQVAWRLSFQPSTDGDRESLHVTVKTEYQLLNSIGTGAHNVWRKFPGPMPLGQAYQMNADFNGVPG